MENIISQQGIATYPEFKNKHKIKASRIFPKDGDSLFAKAFEECYFIHGLQQQGYFWKDRTNEQKNSSGFHK